MERPHKDTPLHRISELTIEIREGGHVNVVYSGGTYKGDHNTIRILDVFSNPTSLQDAVTRLEAWIPGAAAFMEVTQQITSMKSQGIIVHQDDTRGGGDLKTNSSSDFGALPVHIRMINDRRRTMAFQSAVRGTVKPGDVVVEIGTGTGILAVTAAQAGASHVYAIERTPIARVARQVAKINGLSDRITIIEGSSYQVDIPEIADVLVSEVIGNDPLGEAIIPTIEDAAKRFLRSPARSIPHRLRLFALPLDVPESLLEEVLVNENLVAKWEGWYSVKLTPFQDLSSIKSHSYALNTNFTSDWKRICDPIRIADINLLSPIDADIDKEFEIEAACDGDLSGIIIYFDAMLAEKNWFSNSPESTDTFNSWASHMWIPGAAKKMKKNERLRVRYSYNLRGSEFEFV